MDTDFLRREPSFWGKHTLLVDTAVATLLVLFGSLVFVGVGVGAKQTLLMLLLNVAMLGPYAFRRSYPVLAGGIVAAAAIVQLFSLAAVPPSFNVVGVPLAVYWLAAYGPRWSSMAGLGLAIAGGLSLGVALAVLDGWQRQQSWLSQLLPVMIVATICILIVTASWALGDLNRSRRRNAAALAQYTAHLETEAKNARALAAADERGHIAREMHDIVAHSLSVIITQADGARYAASADPAIAVSTLSTIADAGRGALNDMRTLLGVLRTGEQVEDRPQPTLQDIPDLVETMEMSGLTINHRTLGLPPANPAQRFNKIAQLAIFRVIQESLTNALKHGGAGTQADLVVDWGHKGLRVSIANDGQGSVTEDLESSGSGQGLVGIEERVSMLGGTLTAGPLPDHGFKVVAIFPYPQR